MTPATPDLAGRRKTVRLPTLLYGLLLLGLGVFITFMPRMTALGVGVVLGAGLIVAGGAGLVALAAERRVTGFISHLLWALAAIIAGVCVLLHPWPGMLSLTLLLGVGLVAQGLIVAVQGVVHRQRYGRGWSWLLASGLITFIMGALVLAWSPVVGSILPALVLALNLFLYGASVTAAAFDGPTPAPPERSASPAKLGPGAATP